MRTTNDIGRDIEDLIPAALYTKYRHLSYAEMAEITELAPYADELRAAEIEWNALEGQ